MGMRRIARLDGRHADSCKMRSTTSTSVGRVEETPALQHFPEQRAHGEYVRRGADRYGVHADAKLLGGFVGEPSIALAGRTREARHAGKPRVQ